MNLTMKTQRVKKQLLAIAAVSEDQYHWEYLVLCSELSTAGSNPETFSAFFLPSTGPAEFSREVWLTPTHSGRQARESGKFPLFQSYTWECLI